MLKLDPAGLAGVRQELIAARLIAYQNPLYQVLAVDADRPPASGVTLQPSRQPEPPRPKDGVPENLGQILRNLMEKSS